MLKRFYTTVLFLFLFVTLSFALDEKLNNLPAIPQDLELPTFYPFCDDEYHERYEKDWAFQESIKDAEVSEIIALVSERGLRARELGSDLYSYMNFIDWRIEGGALQRETVKAMYTFPCIDNARFFELFDSYAIVKVRGRIGTHPYGYRQIQIDTVIGETADAELEKLIVQRKKTRKMRLKNLGLVTLDHEEGFWIGESEWLGMRFELSLENDARDDLKAVSKRARKYFNRGKKLQHKIEKCIVTHLHGLKNNVRREDDPEWVSEEQFRNALCLKKVHFSLNGDIIWHFDDGGMFWNYGIVVLLNEEYNRLEASVSNSWMND